MAYSIGEDNDSQRHGSSPTDNNRTGPNDQIGENIFAITTHGDLGSHTDPGVSPSSPTSPSTSETNAERETATTVAQSNSSRHLSEWNSTEVLDWFRSYGLAKLHDVLLTPHEPKDGAVLGKIFNWKIKNYEQYRDFYKSRLPTNLHKDFDRFGALLDSFFIDKYTHIFDVAFSFPGDIRERVRLLAEQLCTKINNSSSKKPVFYDEYHRAELARPNLDLYLHDIYRNKTRLIVVFMCADYSLKEWCGLECRCIRSLLHTGQAERIMLLSVDGKTIDGVLNIDGYMDISKMRNEEVVDAIYKRLQALGEPLPPVRYPYASTCHSETTKVLPRSILLLRNALYSVSPWYIVVALLAYIFGTYMGR